MHGLLIGVGLFLALCVASATPASRARAKARLDQYNGCFMVIIVVGMAILISMLMG